MTVEVRIQNCDGARTIRVVEQHHDTPLRSGSQLRPDTNHVLGPGEAIRLHVHAAKSLMVVEDPEAVRSAPTREDAALDDAGIILARRVPLLLAVLDAVRLWADDDRHCQCLCGQKAINGEFLVHGCIDHDDGAGGVLDAIEAYDAATGEKGGA